jgi:anti-sigma B factor antagonist
MGTGSQELEDKLQSLIRNGHRALLVDCGQVSKIDSQGIQALMHGFISLQKRGGHLKLLNLPRRMREVLRLTRLLQFLEAFEDEEVALRSFASQA